MKAMIFAAGLGTRLRPFTDNCPKALIPVRGKPMLEHVILRLKNAGFDQLVINIHHLGQQILDFLEKKKNFGMRIDISDERECLLDTGGAVRKAAPFLGREEPFLVHNADILTDLDLRKFYEVHRCSDALATLLIGSRSTSRYLFFDGENALKGWKNCQTGEIKSGIPGFIPENYAAYAFGGIHVVSPEVFDFMNEWEEKFSIIDFYLSLTGRIKIQGYAEPGIRWIDIGKPESLAEAEKWEDAG